MSEVRKILIVQLARLGDVYQTWPALAAIKRNYPSCEVHLLTRKKFAAAAPKSNLVDRHLTLDTRSILEPLIDEIPNIDRSLVRLATLTSELKSEGYDRIINLSFSSFSSHLIAQIASSRTVVAGYSRFDDGTLRIPDDGSAYFYAQVGPDRANRLHLCDLFAHIAGVSLVESDWSLQVASSVHQREVVQSVGQRPIVVHIGASDLTKTLSWSKWLQVIKILTDSYEGRVVLIGSQEERDLADRASAVTGRASGAPINLVGKTDLDELSAVISKAALVVGGDSAPIHIASLAGVPVLNLSLPIVSFWETGPRSVGSRIVRIESEEKISAYEIATEAMAMVNGKAPTIEVIRVPNVTSPYLETRPQPKAFEWELVQAIYMGEPFPAPPNENFIVAIDQLADVNSLAIEQLAQLRKATDNKVASSILDRVDEVIAHISKLVPEVQPIVGWFQTERTRIGPLDMSELIDATEDIHKKFADVLGIYGDPVESNEIGEGSAV